MEAGCYDGVKVTEESSEDEPGALQHKYYAPEVGGVRVGWAGNDPTKETLELVSVEKLDAAAMAKARAAALKLEKSATSTARTSGGQPRRPAEAGVPAGAIVRTATGG